MATYDQIIEGLEIIRRVMNAAAAMDAKDHVKPLAREQHLAGADHDILWACSISSITDKEDEKRLEALGWFKDMESACWSHFI